jgi:hypothetical protein
VHDRYLVVSLVGSGKQHQAVESCTGSMLPNLFLLRSQRKAEAWPEHYRAVHTYPYLAAKDSRQAYARRGITFAFHIGHDDATMALPQ